MRCFAYVKGRSCKLLSAFEFNKFEDASTVARPCVARHVSRLGLAGLVRVLSLVEGGTIIGAGHDKAASGVSLALADGKGGGLAVFRASLEYKRHE